jgi:hypothetical protein
MPPAAGPVALPHPETIAKLNELSSELGVVGSWNVLAKAQDFRDEVRKPEFAAKINKAKSLNQTIDLHDEETTPFRDAVVIAMRRDLFPWWRWRQRRRPEPPP